MSSSIWGEGDRLTLNLLRKKALNGKWLDLAAGEGRYVSEILKKADHLVVSDIDKKELDKIQKLVPKEAKSKVKSVPFDLTKKFPFKEKYFDGVFCTGTLHMFSQGVLYHIFGEIYRVLKPKGTVILDFATSVKRTERNKKMIDEKCYKHGIAKRLLIDLTRQYRIKMYGSTFEDGLTEIPGYGWITRGRFILLVGRKRN